MVELLLDFEADVNAIDAEGLTAMMAASKRGHTTMARLLAANGAIVNRTDRNDFCALLYAGLAINTIAFYIVNPQLNKKSL